MRGIREYLFERCAWYVRGGFVTKTELLGATKLVCGKSKSKVDLVEKHGNVIGRNSESSFDFEIILVSENEADSFLINMQGCFKYIGKVWRGRKCKKNFL